MPRTVRLQASLKVKENLVPRVQADRGVNAMSEALAGEVDP